MEEPKLKDKLRSFFFKSRRVWYALRKPTMKEFKTISMVSAVGILILGALGFAVSLVMGIFF